MIPTKLKKYIYYQEKDIVLLHGDCREVMGKLLPDSVDTIITDPPYGLEFMGKAWDKAVPGPDYWEAAMRVCKPGAMMMAFGGTRLYHRMTCAIEDAGWEIRDCLMWLYGSGFPKSHDISKAIDKAAGAEREVVGQVKRWGANASGGRGNQKGNDYQASIIGAEKMDNITAPATPEAELWDGWGTALKPAWEPIVLAMKPLDGTFAENALKHGVAGLNIDGGRIGTEDDLNGGAYSSNSDLISNPNEIFGERKKVKTGFIQPKGRFPANLMLDEDTAPMLDEQSGESVSGMNRTEKGNGGIWAKGNGIPCGPQHGDSGGASRFFYIAKPSKADRGHQNTHPTVKPTPLMERLIILQTYLACLTDTPAIHQGGVILDPFGGSGTTAIAAKKAGRPCIIIERDEENLDMAKARLKRTPVPLFTEVHYKKKEKPKRIKEKPKGIFD